MQIKIIVSYIAKQFLNIKYVCGQFLASVNKNCKSKQKH